MTKKERIKEAVDRAHIALAMKYAPLTGMPFEDLLSNYKKMGVTVGRDDWELIATAILMGTK